MKTSLQKSYKDLNKNEFRQDTDEYDGEVIGIIGNELKDWEVIGKYIKRIKRKP